MKRRSLFIIAGATLFSLVSCGAKTTKTRAAHKEYNGYSAKFYDYDTHSWVQMNNLTWAQSFDELVRLSKNAYTDKDENGVVLTRSGEIRSEYLHQCEDLIMETGAICPLYFYADVYLQNPKMVGLYSSPLGFKWFNQCSYKGTNENITVCVGSREDHVDPALNSTVDGGIICLHNFEGLCTWERPAGTGEVGHKSYVSDKVIETYCSITKGEIDPFTGHVTYTINLDPNNNGECESRWSDDNTPLTSDDFIYSWSRAASGKLSSDYGYMFDTIVGYDSTSSNTKEIQTLKGLTKIDNNKFTVELVSDLPYFKELLAFPTYLPVKKSVVESVANNAWWTDANTYVGNGPMRCTKIFNQNGGFYTFVPNGHYPENGKNPCASSIKTLSFSLSDDENQQFNSYKVGLKNPKSGELDFCDTVPQGEIDGCVADAENKGYYCIDQIGNYYIVFNVNDSKLNNYLDTEEKQAKFRRALSLLIDRSYICKSIGKSGQVPASGFVADGAFLYKNNEEQKNIEKWKDTRGKNRKGGGYYYVQGSDDDKTYAERYKETCNEGLEMLKELFPGKYNEKKKKFEGLPSIEYLYNSGTGHKAIGEYLYNCFSAYGIDLKLNQQEWAVFLNTRKSGDFTIARNGWLADFTDPISFIDMWITTSGNNDAQFGK